MKQLAMDSPSPRMADAREHLKKAIAPIKESLKGISGLPEMFENCYFSTLDTTLIDDKDGVFVITGDIPAMWLRDSTAQVLHYLRFADIDSVRGLIKGLIQKQIEQILTAPYANAFTGEAHTDDNGDRPRPSPMVWEEKYEIDSLCYPLFLVEKYLAKTGDWSVVDDNLHKAMRLIVSLFTVEQHHHVHSPYYFLRWDCPPQDTLSHRGQGAPTGYTGMIFSGFRPSDDATRLGYLVPANLFAARVMDTVQQLADKLGDKKLLADAKRLQDEVKQGVMSHGLIDHSRLGDCYTYETDGLNTYNVLDDANVPSLLSLPYLEVCAKDEPLYLSTRKLVLSKANPYYVEGSHAKGIGSPHTPKGYVWHIALSMQALTATDPDEIAGLLDMLVTTTAGTGLMHEGFDANDPDQYTRSWFAWSNSLFAETICRLYEEGQLPDILSRMNAKAIA